MDEAKRVANATLGQQLIDDMRRNFGVAFQVFKPLTAGELVRHQDGGIYRFVGYARGTDDTGLRMLYDHVWPFDPTDIPWDRPALEWGPRFTRITEQDLADEMKQDRVRAQQAITDAKAARRAASGAAARAPEALNPVDVRAEQTTSDLAAAQREGLRFNPLKGGLTLSTADLDRFASGLTCVNRKGELMQLDPFKTVVEPDSTTGALDSNPR